MCKPDRSHSVRKDRSRGNVPFQNLDKLIAEAFKVSSRSCVWHTFETHLVQITRRDLPTPPSDRGLTSLVITIVLGGLMTDRQGGRASLLH